MELVKKNKPKKILKYRFADFSISKKTVKQLNFLGYHYATFVQQKSLPLTLNGRDIILCSKTGSGKTLCFIIPMVEKLLEINWPIKGVIGGCIISPVRELAIQIFTICKNISSIHGIKISLIIGGVKFYSSDKSIIISTIGKLCEEMLISKLLDLDSLFILSVDEIDQILDLGFRKSFLQILRFLPKKKQTLLFSATLTLKIKDLIRLKLIQPIFLCTKKNFKPLNSKNFKNYFIIPKNIYQYYCILDSCQKTNFLYSFLVSHPKAKTIVIFSTNKQVIFFFQAFKKFKPNFPIFQIYGGMKQILRTSTFVIFNQVDTGVLLATDIISRGIDLKRVDWVVQFDCPQNVKSYLHRIGRTGRLSEIGKSLLIVTETENYFFLLLKKFLIPLFQIKIREKQLIKITEKIVNLVFNDKYFYLKAYSAYLHNIRYIFSVQYHRNPDFSETNWFKLAINYGIRQ